jgi:hypothetical protein
MSPPNGHQVGIYKNVFDVLFTWWPPSQKFVISPPQHFFYWQIFTKSLLEKYDFDLKEGFSMKKMAQIH